MGTFDPELNEELAQQLRNVREEVEKDPSDEGKETYKEMGVDTEPLTREQDERPKHDEEIPPLGEQEEKQREEK